MRCYLHWFLYLIMVLTVTISDAQTIKYGTVISISSAQILTGLTESTRWRNNYIVPYDKYHAFRAVENTAWLVAGGFSYATITNNRMTKWEKARILIGSTLIARDAFEFAYRWNAFGNPFDYRRLHNERNIVYIGMRNGKLTDLYIGTDKTTGILVDAVCLIVGGLLLK